MSRSEHCPICGNSELEIVGEERTIRTRDGVELPYDAQFSRCAGCGEEYFTRAQSRSASRAAAGALRRYVGLLEPAEIVAIRSRYGVTQSDLEKILRLGKKTIVRWEAGSVCQSQAADRLLREVRDSPQLFRKLAEEAGVSLRAPSSECASCYGSHNPRVFIAYGYGVSDERIRKSKRHPLDPAVYEQVSKNSTVTYSKLSGRHLWSTGNRVQAMGTFDLVEEPV